MPIRSEHRKFYRAKWRKFRLALIEQAGGQICTVCGTHMQKGINGAHKDHDPRNHRSVVLMCPSCHAHHDTAHRIAIMRRTRSKETGQLWLMPELEWSPYASWEIPGWIYDRMIQLHLFADN